MKQLFNLGDPSQRFTDRVGDYMRYRPDYPEEILDDLRGVGLGPGVVAADIGAGTGIFAELLLRSGADVIGVEPNDAMRAAAETLLGENPRFRAVKGSAEATGLPYHSVDFVTAAQAFHWFDPVATRREFERILKPGGWIALVWNSRRLASTAFLLEYEALLRRDGTDYAAVASRYPHAEQVRDFFGGEVMTRTISHGQQLDREGLRGRLLSSSYTPPEGHPDRAPMLSALDEIFDRHAQDGRVTIEYDTELHLGRLT